MKSFSRAALSIGTAAVMASSLALVGTHVTSAHSSRHAGHARKMAFFKGYDEYIAPNLQLAASLDPADISAASDFGVVGLVYTDLVTINSQGNAVPYLAKSYSVSPNHRVWTFTIRPNARFSNGDKVTAADVVYSIRTANLPSTQSPVANYYDALLQGMDKFSAGKSSSLGVKAIGSNKVQITTTKPAAYFLKALTYPVNDALDPRIVRGANRTQSGNTLTNDCGKNVGSGPFMFQCYGGRNSKNFYKPGTTPTYTLVPNPHFFGPKPHIGIQIGVQGHAETAYDMYLRGQLLITGIPAQYLKGWVHNPRGQFHKVPTSAIGYTSLNTKTAPFNNVNCRLAYAWAINRPQLSAINQGETAPLYDILPPAPKAFLGYFNGAGMPHYNVAKAKSYFAKCPSGTTPFTFDYATGSQQADNAATAEVNMVNTVGFHAKQNGLSQNDWLDRVQHSMVKTNTTAVSNGWIMDYPDSQDYISLLFTCGEGYNIGEWCNSKMTKLAHEADASFNPTTRASLYMRAQKIALQNGYPIMETIGIANFLVSTKVHGGVYTFACGGWCPPSKSNSYANWAKISIK